MAEPPRRPRLTKPLICCFFKFLNFFILFLNTARARVSHARYIGDSTAAAESQKFRFETKFTREYGTRTHATGLHPVSRYILYKLVYTLCHIEPRRVLYLYTVGYCILVYTQKNKLKEKMVYAAASISRIPCEIYRYHQ
jgi:hypothetical protein